MSEHNHPGNGTVPGLDGEPIFTPQLGCLACAEIGRAHHVALAFDIPSTMVGLPDDGRRPDPGPSLIDFLLARIADDEDQARTFLADNHAALERAGLPFRDSAMSFVVRVLAECDAKRRIVQMHEGVAYPNPQDEPVDLTCTGEGSVRYPEECLTLRLLALPYADHPDWREEWRP